MTDLFNISDVTKAGLRSAAVSVPALGSLVQLWNEHEAIELKRRLDQFWNAFALEAQYNEKMIQEIADQVKSNTEDVNYLKELIAIVERSVQYAKLEPSDDKQKLFAVIAINSIAFGPARSFDENISIIDAINMLTITDIEVLKRFQGRKSIKVDDMREASEEESLSILIASLSKLESRGLISETARSGNINAITFYGDSEKWDNKWRIRIYGILPFGTRLLEMSQTKQCN